MRLIYSVEEGAGGWRVRQGLAGVAEGLTPAKAITHARQLGREQHERTGFAVMVELVIAGKSLLLAQHPRLVDGAAAAG